MKNESLCLESILTKNKNFAEIYKKSNLMMLIKSKEMDRKEKRERLLDCIQVFSNYFQKVVSLRHVFCEDSKFLAVTQKHLDEEFSHNISLMKDRKNKAPAWDPILDSTSGWFAWKMLTLDNEEKTLLVHLVLETSANIFFHEAHKIMDRYGETDYFNIHSEIDEEHEKMGMELLEGLSQNKYKRLSEIQSQGWDVLFAACDRIAELT